MSKKTVLFVEDDPVTQEQFRMRMKIFVNVLQATTLSEAEAVIKANPDIDLMAFDGNLRDPENTCMLISEIRKTFAGPMVAASSDEYMRSMQLESGCDHQTEKKFLASYILHELGLSRAK